MDAGIIIAINGPPIITKWMTPASNKCCRLYLCECVLTSVCVCVSLFVNTISEQLCLMQGEVRLVSVCKQMFSALARETKDNYTHTGTHTHTGTCIVAASVYSVHVFWHVANVFASSDSGVWPGLVLFAHVLNISLSLSLSFSLFFSLSLYLCLSPSLCLSLSLSLSRSPTLVKNMISGLGFGSLNASYQVRDTHTHTCTIDRKDNTHVHITHQSQSRAVMSVLSYN